MSAQDKFIFTTGVVGRAMGSGKFTGADIQALTDLAAQAWENTFGKFAEPPEAAFAALGTIPPKPNETSQMPALALPEAKDWSLWKKDKCNSFDKGFRDASWEHLLERAKAKDAGVINIIKEMADSDLGDPESKWYKANERRASRAKTIQLMMVRP
jgi:hypothetical protein